MKAAERRNRTHRLLQEHGHITVSDLSERFGVTEVTIRKDLRYLEEHDLLLRTHGGGILPSSHFVRDRPFEEKAKRNFAAKERIGRKAAALVGEPDTLILDAGTTTLQVARHLEGKKDLTVLTNAVNVALELITLPDIELLILGGLVRRTSASIVGPYAEQILKDQRCRKLFLGVDGFDLEYGLTTTNPQEAHINRLMLDSAEQAIVVADTTKFGRSGLSRICGADEVDVVITDEEAPSDAVAALKERDVAVEIA